MGVFQPGFVDLAVWEGNPFSLGHGFPVLDFRLVPSIPGFMFFANTGISFSIWFFYLVAVLQEGITNRIGYGVTPPDAFVWGMQSLSWQGWGLLRHARVEHVDGQGPPALGFRPGIRLAQRLD